MENSSENQRQEPSERRRESVADAWADVDADVMSEPRFPKADDPAYVDVIEGDDVTRQIAGKLAFGSLDTIVGFARRKGVSDEKLRKIAEVDVHRKLARGAVPEGLIRHFGLDKTELLPSAKRGIAYDLENGDVASAKKLAAAFGLDEDFLRHPRAVESLSRGIGRLTERSIGKDERGGLDRLTDAVDFLRETDPGSMSSVPERTSKNMAALVARVEVWADGAKTAWIAEHLGLTEDAVREAAIDELEKAYERGEIVTADAYVKRFGIDPKMAEQQLIEAVARTYGRHIGDAETLSVKLSLSKDMIKEAKRRAFAEAAASSPEAAERFAQAAGLSSKETRSAAREVLSAQVARGDMENAELTAKTYGIKETEMRDVIRAELLARFERGETEKAVRLAEASKIGQEVLKSKEIQDAIGRSFMRRL